MLDKSSKLMLKFLEEQPNHQISFFTEVVQYPSELGDNREFFSTLRYLESLGYLEIIRSSHDTEIGAILTHMGSRHSDFTRLAFKQYIIDNWIAISALIVSVIALIRTI